MGIILHNVDKAQLPLIRELAKVLGISMEQASTADDNVLLIKAALDRVQSGKAELTTVDWDDFRKMAYGK